MAGNHHHVRFRHRAEEPIIFSPSPIVSPVPSESPVPSISASASTVPVTSPSPTPIPSPSPEPEPSPSPEPDPSPSPSPEDPGRDPDAIKGVLDGFWYRSDVNASCLESTGPDDPCEDGDTMIRWLDQLNANHGNGTAIYQDDPWIEFNGSTHTLSAGVLGSGPSTNNLLAVMVVRFDSVTKNSELLDKIDGTNIGFYSALHDTNDTFFVSLEDTGHTAGGGHSTTQNLLANTWYCLGFFVDWDNSRMRLYINSTVFDVNFDISGLNGNLGNAGNAIIAGTPFGIARLDGDMREITYMHGALSEADIQDIITRFMFRWSV